MIGVLDLLCDAAIAPEAGSRLRAALHVVQRLSSGPILSAIRHWPTAPAEGNPNTTAPWDCSSSGAAATTASHAAHQGTATYPQPEPLRRASLGPENKPQPTHDWQDPSCGAYNATSTGVAPESMPGTWLHPRQRLPWTPPPAPLAPHLGAMPASPVGSRTERVLDLVLPSPAAATTTAAAALSPFSAQTRGGAPASLKASMSASSSCSSTFPYGFRRFTSARDRDPTDWSDDGRGGGGGCRAPNRRQSTRSNQDRDDDGSWRRPRQHNRWRDSDGGPRSGPTSSAGWGQDGGGGFAVSRDRTALGRSDRDGFSGGRRDGGDGWGGDGSDRYDGGLYGSSRGAGGFYGAGRDGGVSYAVSDHRKGGGGGGGQHGSGLEGGGGSGGGYPGSGGGGAGGLKGGRKGRGGELAEWSSEYQQRVDQRVAIVNAERMARYRALHEALSAADSWEGLASLLDDGEQRGMLKAATLKAAVEAFERIYLRALRSSVADGSPPSSDGSSPVARAAPDELVARLRNLLVADYESGTRTSHEAACVLFEMTSLGMANPLLQAPRGGEGPNLVATLLRLLEESFHAWAIEFEADAAASTAAASTSSSPTAPAATRTSGGGGGKSSDAVGKPGGWGQVEVQQSCNQQQELQLRIHSMFLSLTAARKLKVREPAFYRAASQLAAPLLGREIKSHHLRELILTYTEAGNPVPAFLERALHEALKPSFLQSITHPIFAGMLLNAAAMTGTAAPQLLDPVAHRLINLIEQQRQRQRQVASLAREAPLPHPTAITAGRLPSGSLPGPTASPLVAVVGSITVVNPFAGSGANTTAGYCTSAAPPAATADEKPASVQPSSAAAPAAAGGGTASEGDLAVPPASAPAEQHPDSIAAVLERALSPAAPSTGPPAAALPVVDVGAPVAPTDEAAAAADATSQPPKPQKGKHQRRLSNAQDAPQQQEKPQLEEKQKPQPGQGKPKKGEQKGQQQKQHQQGAAVQPQSQRGKGSSPARASGDSGKWPKRAGAAAGGANGAAGGSGRVWQLSARDVVKILKACSALSYRGPPALLPVLAEEAVLNENSWRLWQKLQASRILGDLGYDVVRSCGQDGPSSSPQQQQPPRGKGVGQQEQPAPVASPKKGKARKPPVILREEDVLAFLQQPDLKLADLLTILKDLARFRSPSEASASRMPSTTKPANASTAGPDDNPSTAAQTRSVTEVAAAAADDAAAGTVATSAHVRMPSALATAVQLVDAAAPMMGPAFASSALSSLTSAGVAAPVSLLLRAQELFVNQAETETGTGAVTSGSGDAASGGDGSGVEDTLAGGVQGPTAADRRRGFRKHAVQEMCARVGRVLAWQPNAAAAAYLNPEFVAHCKAAARSVSLS